MSACDGSVQHTGDNQDGRAEGFDEEIHIDVDAIPAKVCVAWRVCCMVL